MSPLRGGAWRCLMYHDIAPGAVSSGGGPEWFAVPLAAFARHLDLIREAGYLGCSIARALEHDGPCLAISFDDGVRSHYEHAFPALVERGMTATFFIITDWVGRPGYATWSELREMRKAGMSIQSHTRSHPFLSELDGGALSEELVGSKATLDDGLGQETDQLALPGGDAPRGRLRGLIAEAGYRVVATSRWGSNGQDTAEDVKLIRRCTVAGDPGEEYFRRVLHGDPSISRRRQLRERVLGGIRTVLGPSRYAAWRRQLLGRMPVGPRRH